MARAESFWRSFGCLLLLLSIAGCGAHSPNQNCEPPTPTLRVFPSSATGDHTLTPPGSSFQFTAELGYFSAPPGCAIPLNIRQLTNVVWSLSDNTNAKISNAQDMTYGVATCSGTSALPITVTATLPADQNLGPQQTATATLVCK
jgi:hypothetical protein